MHSEIYSQRSFVFIKICIFTLKFTRWEVLYSYALLNLLAEKFCIHMNSEIYSQRSFVFIKKLHFYSLRSFVFIKKLQFYSLRSFVFIKKLHFYSLSIHKNLHIQCQIISQSTFLANSQYFPTLKPLVFYALPYCCII